MNKKLLTDLKDTLTTLHDECLNQINERRKILEDKKLFTDMIEEAEQLITLKELRKNNKEQLKKRKEELVQLKKKWDNK